MGAYHLAQLNVARAVAALDDSRMVGFMSRLDEVNALAERSPGYVWRLKSDAGNATDIRLEDGDPLVIINLTVWETIDALFDFTYRSNHKTVFARRHDWFERRSGPNVVLWWQPAESHPSTGDAVARLQRLADLGPTPDAFTFKQRFPPPD